MPRARATNAERTLDAQLAEIEVLKRRLEELRGWRADAARTQIGTVGAWRPGPYAAGNYTVSELAELERISAYIEECDTGIRELEREIQDKWTLAGGLTDSPDRLAGDDDEIARQASALDDRRRQLEASRGTFAEDQHDRVDAVLAERRSYTDALLASPLGATEIEQLAAAWVWRDEGFREALHKAIDAHPERYTSGVRSSWQAEIDLLGKQAARRRAELSLREQEKAAKEAEAARARAQVELAATVE